MKIEIEVDVAPENWEYVGFKVPDPGEYYFCGGMMTTNGVLSAGGNKFPVFKRRVEVPSISLSLKPGWVAKDIDGYWCWYPNRPELGEKSWMGGDNWLGIGCLFNFPVCDWKESLRRVV